MSDTQGHVGGSIERTLAGDAELEILPVLREAWARTEGIKAIMVGGLLLIYAAIGALVVVVAGVAASFRKKTAKDDFIADPHERLKRALSKTRGGFLDAILARP